jgi:type II secretory pathway pseudopilin PulG
MSNRFQRLAKKARNQGGDTLVEVLICIMIVSTILTGAYVTTNSSNKAVRNAQEHAEALKLIQGQLEEVRYSAKQPTPNIFGQPADQPFCMVDGTIVQVTGPSEAQCVLNGGGSPTTTEPAYRISITRGSCAPYTAPAPAVCNKVIVKAVWQSVSSDTQANEVISSRMYQ